MQMFEFLLVSEIVHGTEGSATESSGSRDWNVSNNYAARPGMDRILIIKSRMNHIEIIQNQSNQGEN